jgi:hypothetical protein
VRLPQSPELHQHAGQDRSENDAETGPVGERQDLLRVPEIKS